jgi:hypothetical protein
MLNHTKSLKFPVQTHDLKFRQTHIPKNLYAIASGFDCALFPLGNGNGGNERCFSPDNAPIPGGSAAFTSGDFSFDLCLVGRTGAKGVR